jgi:hypothetical protein
MEAIAEATGKNISDLLRAKIETLFSISSQLRPIRPMRDVIPHSCEIKGQREANSILWLSAFKHLSIE